MGTGYRHLSFVLFGVSVQITTPKAIQNWQPLASAGKLQKSTHCQTPKRTFKNLTIPILLGIVEPMTGKFVAYYRVSTTKQGINGLGMDAQRNAVFNYLNGGKWALAAEFAEVETGKRNDRQELGKAIALCRKEGATLLIAKLDRLARNAAFLLNLRDSGVDFIAVDMPHADKFTVGIMALVAEKERDMISQRTKDGLAAARRRGTRLGNPRPQEAVRCAVKANQERAEAYAQGLTSVIQQIKKAHVTSLRGIAQCLNARGFTTPNGKTFAAQSVKNLLDRQSLLEHGRPA
jgi:DNA invertase Pin-like site-specific DNA recombinase